MTAANLGEDTDTTAAICDQIAEAYYGYESIPEKWRERVDLKNEIKGLALALMNNKKIKAFNETTFGGAQALLHEAGLKVIYLNFASAKNPDGGFSGGSQAQEASLARASGLYS